MALSEGSGVGTGTAGRDGWFEWASVVGTRISVDTAYVSAA